MSQLTRRGFTLIELSIAIAFLSMLLLIIINTTKGITSTYSKGLSMKKINSVGRDLIDEFTETVVNSTPIDPKIICAEYYGKNNTDVAKKASYDNCIADNAYKFIYQQHVYGEITSYGQKIKNAPAFGMFCAGTYSYIWNTGYAFDNDTFLSGASGAGIPRVNLLYSLVDGDDAETPPNINIFRLLKIHDPSHIVCANQLFDSYPAGDNIVIDVTSGAGVVTGGQIGIDITKNRLGKPNHLGIGNAPEELITTSEFGGLALYQYVIYPPSIDSYSGNRFYSGSFVLGTLNSGATINPSGDSCTVPPGYRYDTDYCALNKFNFAIRATGGN